MIPLGKDDSIDLIMLAQIINKCLTEAYDQGFIEADEHGDITIDKLFSFDPNKVVHVHTHLKGQGDGVYFRLDDSRVFNGYGEACPESRELYDSVSN